MKSASALLIGVQISEPSTEIKETQQLFFLLVPTAGIFFASINV
jgi:hypothetical protein